jgi:hypothetical protein
MTTEASVRNEESTLEAGRLGAGFIRWGTGLFIFGLIIGYGPLLHYMHGAVEGDIGPAFLKNLTLWFACPWALAVYFAHIGGGSAQIARSLHCWRARRISYRLAWIFRCRPFLAEFLLRAGRSLKECLALQGASIAFYVAGVIFAFGAIRRASHQYEGSGETAA